MTPYTISDNPVQEVRWIWIDYKDEETGEEGYLLKENGEYSDIYMDYSDMFETLLNDLKYETGIIS